MPATLIREHDRVALLSDLAGTPLNTGDCGVVVFVHQGGEAFEVEFPTSHKSPRYLVQTVEPQQLLRLNTISSPATEAA